MKLVIGVTGGIASGKSNVCNVIKELGYPVIDCDKITKELSEINKPIYNAILNNFGNDFLLEDDNLDKKRISKLVFSDPSKKMLLDSITHPIIKDEVLRQLSLYESGLVFVEIPLLYEAKFDSICDKVICVFLSKKKQVERLIEREGIDEDYALKKIHSQMDLYMKKSLADYVIDSQGDFDNTKKQVIKTINDILGGN